MGASFDGLVFIVSLIWLSQNSTKVIIELIICKEQTSNSSQRKMPSTFVRSKVSKMNIIPPF